MIKKSCALILNNEKVLIIKDKKEKVRKFPTIHIFDADEEYFGDIASSFSYLVDYRLEESEIDDITLIDDNDTVVEGKFFTTRLIKDRSPFFSDTQKEWVYFSKLNSIKLDSYSKILIEDILNNKYDYIEEKLLSTEFFTLSDEIEELKRKFDLYEVIIQKYKYYLNKYASLNMTSLEDFTDQYGNSLFSDEEIKLIKSIPSFDDTDD